MKRTASRSGILNLLGSNMIILLVTVLIICLQSSQGMKCRENGGNTSKQDFNDVVRACMANLHEEGGIAIKKPGATNTNNYFNTRNDENRNDYQGQMRPQNQANQHNNRGNGQQQFDNRKGGGGYNREDSDESLYPPHYNGYRPTAIGGSNGNNNNNGFGLGNYYTTGRNPSSSAGSGSTNNPFEQNRGNNNKRPQNNNTNNREPSKHGSASPLEEIEPCIIHCVFQQMRMLGSGSKPDKNSVLSVMTQKLRNPELREFIQDSVNDCFESVESEPQYQIGKCDFSKKLALCLEEKGQQNCEDWDEEDEDDANNKRKGNNSNTNNRYPNNGNNNNNNYNSNPRPNNNPYRG